MKRFLIFVFCILISFYNLGQNKFKIKGIIKNTAGKNIYNANLSFYNPSLVQTSSDKNGKFEISMSSPASIELSISHVSYKTELITITKRQLKKAKDNTLFMEITLKEKSLKEFVVTSKSIRDTVFGNEETSVSDYEFIDGKILILSYKKSLKKSGYLQLTSTTNELISTTKTPSNPRRLFKDFENKIYLITKSEVFLITIFNKDLRLRPVDKNLFYAFTKKVIDTVNNHFVYSNFTENYPGFNYYSQHTQDTSSKTIHHVEDTFMMDLYRAEYKYANPRQKLWAFRQELLTGIDKEIWVGATNFTQSLYYEKLYAPLFVNKDTLLIFDHYSDLLYKVNSKNFEKMDSISISYHKNKDKKNWEQPILKDKKEGEIYALFLKHGYFHLKPINLTNGKTKVSFKLKYRYAENVKINNGYAYYIYRPYESAQKKYLYREIIQY